MITFDPLRRELKKTRENLNRLPREVEATLPSWVKCTYPISAETLEEVRSTVLVWLANVSNYVQETNQHFPGLFLVKTRLCTDSRAHSTIDEYDPLRRGPLNHGEVDFEWFARRDLRRKNIVIPSLNLNIFKPRLWSAFIRQMILSDVNVPEIGESDFFRNQRFWVRRQPHDIVVGSVELNHTYYRGYTQQRGMLRLSVFNDVGISSEIKDEICSKLESAVQALKSRISRICGINELERRTRRTKI